MGLPKERSSRYVTVIYAIFIVLFAFTLTLFYISRCQKSSRLAKKDDAILKPGNSAENIQEAREQIDITEKPSIITIETPDSYNLSGEKSLNSLPPKKDSSDDEKVIGDRLKTPSAVATIPEDKPSPSQPALITFGQPVAIFFSAESPGLTKKALEKLEAIFEFLTNNPDAEIIIEGYGDSNKIDQNNKRLSQLRAEIVKNHLVRKGIAIKKIKAFWMSSENLATRNHAQEESNKTHRVEVKLKKNQ